MEYNNILYQQNYSVNIQFVTFLTVVVKVVHVLLPLSLHCHSHQHCKYSEQLVRYWHQYVLRTIDCLVTVRVKDDRLMYALTPCIFFGTDMCRVPHPQ